METLECDSDVCSVASNQNNLFGSVDGKIHIWMPDSTDKWILNKELDGHTGQVCSVSFNRNNLLASGSLDKTIRI